MDISVPFPIFEILVTPEPTKRIKLSDDIQQTLSAQFGYDGEGRRPLRCSRSGTAFMTGPVVAAFMNIIASSSPHLWVGDDLMTTEVLLVSWSSNSGNILIALDESVGGHNYMTLTPGDGIALSIGNLNRLNISILLANDLLSIGYSR